jgi:hypothetical protein
MATYAEINSILTDTVSGAQALRERVGVACLVAAHTIIAGNDTSDPPWATGGHSQRVKWVLQLLGNPEFTARQVFGIVLAANISATQSQILSATDSAIQSAVNGAIDTLAENLV